MRLVLVGLSLVIVVILTLLLRDALSHTLTSGATTLDSVAAIHQEAP